MSFDVLVERLYKYRRKLTDYHQKYFDANWGAITSTINNKSVKRVAPSSSAATTSAT